MPRCLSLDTMNTKMNWISPPDHLALAYRELHIWRARLDAAEDFVKGLAAHLSPEEIARTGKFVFARDRTHFIVARGTLRTLLGLYLRKPPAAVALCTGPLGKPQLCEGIGEPPLKFNLSHSHGLALYGFAMQQEVGIDLEMLRPEIAAAQVAERFFSAREQRELQALPPELRVEGFFLCWTRKEAYLKARGDGLQMPLDKFDVTLTPHGPVELASKDSETWTLTSFTPAPDYVAAVVTDGCAGSTQFFESAGVILPAAGNKTPC